MIRRTTRHVIELVAALLTAAMIGIGLIAWLIASGPVSLGVLKPTIASALSNALDAPRVDFDKALIEWVEEGAALRLKVVDARVHDETGAIALRVPELQMGFAVSGLLRGLLAPTRIAFTGATARIVRSSDGRMSLGFAAPGGRPVVNTGPSPDNPAQAEPPVQEAGAAQTGDGTMASRLLGELSGPRDRSKAIGYLEEIAIRDARIVFEDQLNGMEVEARRAALTLARGDPGLTVALDAAVRLGREPVEIAMAGRHDPETRATRLTLSFTDVALPALAQLLPGSEPLKDIDMPVRGDLGLTLSEGGLIGGFEIDLVGGPGKIDLPPTDKLPMVEADAMETMLAKVPDHIAIQSAGLSAAFDVKTGALTLRGLSLNSDGTKAMITGTGTVRFVSAESWEPAEIAFDLNAEDMVIDVPVYSERPAEIDRLALTGTYDAGKAKLDFTTIRMETFGGLFDLSGSYADVEGGPEVYLKGTVGNFPADQLMVFWPQGAALGARDWISANVSQGRIVRGDLNLEAPAGTFDVGYIPNEALRFEFTMDDMVSNFVPGLPPLTDLKAKATLLGDTFKLDVDSARIGRVKVREGGMLTETLHIRGSLGNFNVVLDGPLSDVLHLLDMGPFGYPSRYGIVPATVGGQGSLRLTLSLPMKRNLKVEQIEFAAAANLADLRLPGIAGETDLQSESLFLQINGAGLVGKGPVKLGQFPAELEWREDFTGLLEFPTQYELKTVLDETVREDLGLGLEDMIDGPITASLIAKGRGKDLQNVSLETDLQDAALTVAAVGWEKPKGQPAAGRMQLAFPEDGGYEVNNLSIVANDVLVRGGFALGADAKLLKADFSRVKLGPVADFKALATREGEMLILDISGDSLNLAPFIDTVMDAGASASTSAEPGPGSAIKVNARLNRVDLKNGVQVRDSTLTVFSDTGRVEDLSFRGAIEGGTVHVDVKRATPVTRRVIATTTNAGTLIKGLLDNDEVSGGRLNLTATLLEPEPGSADVEIDGTLQLEQFRVMNVPLLARLLTVGSFTGLGDLLQGEGIWFDKLDVPFKTAQGVWTLEDGRAYGPSLGLTIEGGLDTDMAATDLKGTIVPAYAVNSVLGKVPLIGDLFVNREGEGLFAITYRIVGSEEGSNIYVNPLSALAPGFLRRLFELDVLDDEPSVAPKEAITDSSGAEQ